MHDPPHAPHACNASSIFYPFFSPFFKAFSLFETTIFIYTFSIGLLVPVLVCSRCFLLRVVFFLFRWRACIDGLTGTQQLACGPLGSFHACMLASCRVVCSAFALYPRLALVSAFAAPLLAAARSGWELWDGASVCCIMCKGNMQVVLLLESRGKAKKLANPGI